jgi:hypothetical protein
MVASLLSRRIKSDVTHSGNYLLPSVRVPDDLYERLRQIRLPLEEQYQSAAPTVQDIVNVALKQFIQDWKEPDKQPELLSQLLEHRRLSRKRMGSKKHQIE